jgi:hypothetical protein
MHLETIELGTSVESRAASNQQVAEIPIDGDPIAISVDDAADEFDGLNVVIPVVFAALVWVSIAMIYPNRAYLSLIALIPAILWFSVLFVVKKVCRQTTVRHLPNWVTVFGNFGVGIFLSIIAFSLQLLLLFMICVFAYSFLQEVWDGSIHGFADSWQTFAIGKDADLLLTNVILSIVSSVSVFAVLSEMIKFFIIESIQSITRIRFEKYIWCIVAGMIGFASAEAMSYAMISGDLLYSIIQITFVFPLHILTGVCIGVESVISPGEYSRMLGIPILIQAVHRLQAYLLKLLIPNFYITLSIYCSFTLILIIGLGIYARLQFKKIPANHWIEPERERRMRVFGNGRLQVRLVSEDECVDVSSLTTAAPAA